MKKTRKKLTLNRETIGNLTDDRLNEAAGGAKSGPSCFSHCMTNCNNCPSRNNTICNTGCLPCGTQTDCIG